MSTPKRSNLSKSNSLDDAIAGMPPAASQAKTTRKSTPSKGAAEAALPKAKTTAKTDAQSSLEKARTAVESFAQVNAAQAHELGVQLADAEAAFPLAMMSAYQNRKAEIQAGGLDTATFLDGLTEQVVALEETSVTIALPTTSGAALLPGTPAEA